MTRMWYYKLYRSARKGLPSFKTFGLKGQSKPDSRACSESGCWHQIRNYSKYYTYDKNVYVRKVTL